MNPTPPRQQLAEFRAQEERRIGAIAQSAEPDEVRAWAERTYTSYRAALRRHPFARGFGRLSYIGSCLALRAYLHAQRVQDRRQAAEDALTAAKSSDIASAPVYVDVATATVNVPTPTPTPEVFDVLA